MNTFAKTGLALGALLAALGAGSAEAQTKAPGYVIIEFKVKDAEAFKTYGQRAPATVTQYGGKFAVRGAKPENLKGEAPQGPFLVLTFESAEQARKWASSPEYTALVPLRDQGADTRAFIVEGASP
jgi:uncharacterized protein (DUF1330 family)